MIRFTITDLREVPAFADVIADRGWNAWWTDTDLTAADYRAGLTPMLSGAGIPLALVAHDAARYLGSALVIDNDLASRPQHTPWIAALWVEVEARRQGIAGRLIEAARAKAASLGHQTCYLCASPENTPYYLARDFRLLETDVEGLNVFVI